MPLCLMRKPSLVSFLAWIFCAIPAACLAQTPSGPLRPSDLLANPQKYLNQSVTIDVVEPLYGPATPAALAALEYGQVRIQIPDAMGGELALVPAAFQANDPNRYKKKFDRVLTEPLRVSGTFLRDDDLAKQSGRPAYVIRVASLEALTPPAPQTVASLEEIKADPARFDRKTVVYEGVYRHGFEISSLDGDIWLGTQPNAVIIGAPTAPPQGRAAYRVRATGTLFSKPGAHYGHLGGYSFQLIASKLEYLGPAAP